MALDAPRASLYSARMTHEPPPDPQARPAFSDVVRTATQGVHREAERAGFIADLIRGRATRPGYALFLANLAPAYDALERALAGARTPELGAFADPRLHRLAALRADLEAMAEPGAPAADILASARAYAVAIEAAAEEPARLAAHAYARYLGDLSGGQILKPVLARSLGLAPAALGFYEFPAIEDHAAMKSAMRDTLDRFVVGSAPAEAFLDEAVAAFRHNIALSEAVRQRLA